MPQALVTVSNIEKIEQGQALVIKTDYIHAATSDNTRKAYQKDIRHFWQWGGQLPCSMDTVIKYLHDHAQSLNHRTLSRRLTAISHWHTYQNCGSDPTQHPSVKKTLAGIRNLHGKPKEKAPALTLAQLELMVSFLKQDQSLLALRNSALLQIGFFGAFRRSELVLIKYEDIQFFPEGIEILIPRSKTDQSGEGQVCAIPYGNDHLCPITALKLWCKEAGINSGYLFRSVNNDQSLKNEAISPQTVNLIIKNVATECKIPNAENFSGHSLRRGFATSASKNGASFNSIMRHGRWKHDETVRSYIEEGQRFEDNAAAVILSN